MFICFIKTLFCVVKNAEDQYPGPVVTSAAAGSLLVSVTKNTLAVWLLGKIGFLSIEVCNKKRTIASEKRTIILDSSTVTTLTAGFKLKANSTRWRMADEQGIALQVTLLAIQNSNRIRELLTNQNDQILDFNAEILKVLSPFYLKPGSNPGLKNSRIIKATVTDNQKFQRTSKNFQHSNRLTIVSLL